MGETPNSTSEYDEWRSVEFDLRRNGRVAGICYLASFGPGREMSGGREDG
jgi:hypothetical protein